MDYEYWLENFEPHFTPVSDEKFLAEQAHNNAVRENTSKDKQGGFLSLGAKPSDGKKQSVSLVPGPDGGMMVRSGDDG